MIFEMNNMRAFPTTFALLIEPYKTIWETDEDEHKANAIQVFSYIELMCSPKKANPFYSELEDKRSAKVKKEVYGNPDYKDTTFMITGIIKYKELLKTYSLSYPLLEAAVLGRDGLVNFLTTLDLTDTTDSGTLKLKPRDVTNALKDIHAISVELEALRAKVDQELTESAKTRNQREIGMYER